MELEIKFTKAYLLSRQRALRDAGHIELPFHSWCEGCENEEQEATKIVLLLSHFCIVYISCKSGHHGCAPFNKPTVLVHFVNLFGKTQECMTIILTFTFNLVCSLALRLSKLCHKPAVFFVNKNKKTTQKDHVMCCVWRRLNNVTSCFCLFYLLFFIFLLTRESMFCSKKP